MGIKIDYIKLENLVSIHAGLGKNKLEIDFTKGKNDKIMFIGNNGCGKAQPNSSIVYTPSSYKKIGDIKIGDSVLSEKGIPIKVIGVFPQGKLEVYRVTFNDNTYVDTGKDHLFKVLRLTYRKNTRESYYTEKIMTVEEILNSGLYNGNTLKYYIPMTLPVEFSESELKINPYVLGCLIADGGITDSIRFSNSEEDVISSLSNKLDDDYFLKKTKNREYDYSIIMKEKNSESKNRYKLNLKELGLFGKKSEGKFIPDIYKYNSFKNRLELLRGLIDCDGSIEKGNSIYYYTASKKLAEDVRFLVESIGGTVAIYEKPTTFSYNGEKKTGQLIYRVFIKSPSNIDIYTSKKHHERYNRPKMYKEPNRKIKSIEKLNKKEEMTCIKVDSDQELYLTNNFIVTHNTVLMSNLHPYRNTNDDREMSILDGSPKAYKEIHFNKNGVKYIIQHHYGKNSTQNKSFISKDGEQLNENGGIKLFNEIVEKELDITPDYFAVGRLGSNVQNFIDYSTVDRKKYINKFIPNIDDYLEGYRIVSDKVFSLNKQLKSLKIELEKYDTLEDIENKKNDIEKKIKTYNRLREGLLADLTTISNKIDNNKLSILAIKESNNIELTSDLGIDSLTSLKNNSIKKVSNLSNVLEDIYKKYEALRGYDIDKINQSLNSWNILLTEINGEINTLKAREDSTTKSINKNTERLHSNERKLQSMLSEDLDQLRELLNDYGKKIEKYNREVTKLVDDNGISLDDPMISNGIEYIENTINLSNMISNGYSNISTMFDNDVRSNVTPESFKDNIISQLNRKLDTLANNFSANTTFLSKLMEKYSTITKSSGLLDLLNSSKNHEHTKDCPFVPMALDFKDGEYTSIGDIENKIERTKKILETIATGTNLVQETVKYVKVFNNSIYKPFNDNPEVFSNLDITEENILSLLNGSYLSFEYNLIEKPLLCKRIVLLNNEINTYKKEASHLQDRISSTISVMKDSEEMKKENTELEASIKLETEELANIIQDVSDRNKAIRSRKMQIQIVENIKSNRISLDEEKAYLDKIEESIKLLSESLQLEKDFKDEEKRLNESISINESMTSQLDKELDTIRYQYFLIKENVSKLNNINEVYSDFIEVKDSLDPKKGIPLIFINNYLIDIAERANELLSVAYKDSFTLNFEVNEKEFRIEVIKDDGTMLSDISLASQGETAMTNTSLSLAMMHNITKGYNILYLDEVDATLDNNNRRSFLDVIDKQIESLGTEQTFIISHNNELYNADVDLILLNGYGDKVDINDKTFISNKTILYKNE